MKKILPILCIAAVLAGCGKVDQASSSKSEPLPVVKGGTVRMAEDTSQSSEETSGARGYSENYIPPDTARGDEAKETTTFKPYVAGERTGGAPTVTSIPRPVKPGGSSKPAESVPTPVTPPARTTTAPTTEPTTVPEIPAEIKAFSGVLGDIVKDGTVPGGASAANTDKGEDVHDNEFFIADVDLDGRDELVFIRSNTSAEDRYAKIYGVGDEGELIEELSSYSALTFYSNGVITVESADSELPGGGFMPYTLYRYDPSTDTYDNIAYVTALDRAEVERLAQEAAENGTEPVYTYPEEADTSDSGKVYYIAPSGSSESPQPIDKTAYDEWLLSYINNEEVMTYSSSKLSEDNIKALTSQN